MILSGTLLRFTGYQREIHVDADTLESAIHAVVEQHPALRKVLLDGKGAVRSAHQLFVDGEQVPRRALDTPLAPKAVVEILTAIAGG